MNRFPILLLGLAFAATSRAPVAPTDVPAGAATYAVRSGDTFVAIYYRGLGGRKAGYEAFAVANAHVPDPAFIVPGDVLVVPEALASGPKAETFGAVPYKRRLAAVPAGLLVPEKEQARTTMLLFYVLSFLLTALALSFHRRGADGRMRWAIVAIQVAMTTRYLAWRWMYTINQADPLRHAVSIALFSAEAYSFFSFILFYLEVLWQTRRNSTPLIAEESKLPTVDVYVTIYSEPAEVLYPTLVGCAAIDYPADKLRVYVLDDGGREDVRELAKSFGFGYLTRPDNSHAKAGNINAALPRTAGELIAILDTDHVPTRALVKQMVGHFKDEKVALVQTPHHFYNPDSYQRNLKLEREVVHEQDLFFNVILPGRDTFNSAFFAGSAGMLRRSALESIGGFRTESLIEDMHTTIALHALGWRSIYVPHPVAGGLSPETFSGYLKQRERWVRGGVQVFVRDNPLFKPGLSPMQRVHYLASLLWFFHSWPRLVFLLAPLAYLLFGLNPIVSDVWVLTAYFLPHYLAQNAAFAMAGGAYRNPFWSDAYETATVFWLTRASVSALLKPRGYKFEVTPKGLSFGSVGSRWAFTAPHLVLLALTLAGIGVGAYHLAEGARWDATALSFVWAAYNCVLLGASVHVSRDRDQIRTGHRLSRRVACDVRGGGAVLPGRTTDLSEAGASVLLDEAAPIPKRVELTLKGEAETAKLDAEVMRGEWLDHGGYRLGLRYVDGGDPARRAALRQIFSPPGVWDSPYRAPTSFWSSLTHLWRSAQRRLADDRTATRRSWSRLDRRVPCSVSVDGRRIDGATTDVSPTGVSVTLPESLPTGARVVLTLGGFSPISVECEVARSGTEGKHGLRFASPEILPLAAFGGEPVAEA